MFVSSIWGGHGLIFVAQRLLEIFHLMHLFVRPPAQGLSNIIYMANNCTRVYL